MSTGLSRYSEHLVEARKDNLKSAFYGLMDDEDFIRAITYSVNDMKKVKYRFAGASKMFEEVFGDRTT